jgi:uncharacterized protein YggE
MRLVRLALLLGLAALGQPAGAQAISVGLVSASEAESAAAQPVSVTPLAPGEILLEVSGEGFAYTAADSVRLQLVLIGRGTTQAEARRELERQSVRLSQALAGTGVGESDVGPPGQVSPPLGFVGNEQGTGWSADPQAQEAPQRVERRPLEIRLRDLSRLEAVRTAVETAGFEVGALTYGTANERLLVRDARRAAVMDLRARADDLAAAAGMRVLRLVRLSERVAMSDMGQVSMQRLMQQMMGLSSGSAERVERSVMLSADFALGPQ